MIRIQANSANGAWVQALDHLKKSGAAQDSRYGDTTELLHVGFQIDNPRQRVVFARDINPAFAIAEVIWILAGANDAKFLENWNKKMGEFTDEGIPYFHGAYGYRLGFKPDLEATQISRLQHSIAFRITEIDQVKAVLNALEKNQNSRQAVLSYWHGDHDLPSPDEKSKDIPCNLASHLLIRGGKLEWLQIMRSNDMIWGTPYNFIQFMTLQEIFAGWLNVEVGTYNHVSDSLHIYDKHKERYLATPTPTDDDITNGADLRMPYPEWEISWRVLVDIALGLNDAKKSSEVLTLLDRKNDLSKAYQEWVHLLCAEALKRLGDDAPALQTIVGAGPYWSKSWLKWYQRPKKERT